MNIRDFLKVPGGTQMYWALVLEPGWVQSAIWQIEDGSAQILATSPVTAWATDEELIDASDTSLSAAIQSLPEDIKEPETTVFGVPSSWVSDGQIKEEYLEKIKKICTELSLKPSGFVVLAEAISNLYKLDEGAPVSAIILGVTKESLEVSVFRMGNLVGTATVSRSVSAFDDLVEGLTRFASSEALPSRILIYDGKEGELEDIRQEITEKDWDNVEKIKFLHTPKVEILLPEKKVSAVALAGASEIGDVKGLAATPNENEEEVSQEPEVPMVHRNLETPTEDLGFVVGEDVSQKTQDTTFETPEQSGQNETPEFKKPGFQIAGLKTSLSEILFKFKTFLKTLPFFRRPSGPAKQNFVLIAGIGIVVLLVSFLVYWWFIPKATITVYVSPQTLEEEVVVRVDEDGSDSVGDKVLSGKREETSISGEQTAEVIGRKVVGETAKGKVTVRNGTSSDIDLVAGTTLISSGNLRYLTTQEAAVTAALSPNSPGTAEIAVEAAAIGSEYNLPSEESFKVGNYPKADVDAVAAGDISGGSSREIRAVSLEDRQNLLGGLENELLSEAESKLSGTISSDRTLLSDSFEVVERNASFDNEVGDEAEDLLLNLSLEVSGLSVDKNSLFEISKEVLKDKIPMGYVLRGEQIKTDFELLGSEDGVFEFKTRINANLLPEIKTDEIAKQIAGRVPARAEEFLNSIPGFSQAEIRLSPKLPGIFGTIPRITKNINIEIAAQR